MFHLMKSKMTFVTVKTQVKLPKYSLLNFSMNDIENISLSGGHLCFPITTNLVKIQRGS